MKHKTVTLCKERDVTLSPYIVTKEKKAAFLLCPGGAYNNCEESESKPVAQVLNKLGYNAFVLRYSVGKHYKWPYPLEDFDRAMEYIAEHAEEYHVDAQTIVAAGFSAGGHVVAVAASQAQRKPFAAILCYGLTAGETLAFCAPDAPDASEAVNADTCPVFFASSRNDWIVPVHNTTRLMEALERHYIDYEAHIYGYALHGFSIGAEVGAKGPLFCSRVGNWVEDSLQWVDELMSGRYMSIRECAQYNDANAAVLSTMNSCALIFENDAARKVLKSRFPAQYVIYTAAQKKIGDFMDTVSLRNLFQLLKVSEKTIAKIDQAFSVFLIERQQNED